MNKMIHWYGMIMIIEIMNLYYYLKIKLLEEILKMKKILKICSFIKS